MYGDNDISKAVTEEELIERFGVYDPNKDVSWDYKSVKEIFDEVNNGEDFTYLFSDLLHYLSRKEAKDIDVNLFMDEPNIYDGIPFERYVLVACVIHYHLYYKNLEIPKWVLSDKYKTNVKIIDSKIHWIIREHGITRRLGDIGVIEIG